MNVISLFDGIACARVALERAGIRVNKYFASDVDGYAITIAQKNYPDLIPVGDVHFVNGDMFPKIDLLIGGSPCQGFSFAGKQAQFNDPRSALFFEYVRILKECRPKWFLLENVQMKQESKDVISELLGVEPVMINSALVSAQNRKRLYWTNIPVEQPEDKGTVLADILETGHAPETKSLTLTGTYSHATPTCYLKKRTRQMVTCQGEKRLMVRGKSNAITATIHKENVKSMLKRGKLGLVVGCQQVGEATDVSDFDQIRRVYSPDHKSPTATSWACRNGIKVAETEQEYRKLTPIECERLQTLPDNYTSSVSNTQRYKMLGNGFTAEVIAHILRGMVESQAMAV